MLIEIGLSLWFSTFFVIQSVTLGGGWVIQKWTFQRDVVIEQPQKASRKELSHTSFFLMLLTSQQPPSTAVDFLVKFGIRRKNVKRG